MEQVFKDRMELYHPHTPVQITDKALSVFQVTEPLLVVFIFGIYPEKGEVFLISLMSVERNANFKPRLFFSFSSSKSSVFWVTK